MVPESTEKINNMSGKKVNNDFLVKVLVKRLMSE